MNFNKELISYIYKLNERKRLLLFRNDEELSFLNEFLKNKLENRCEKTEAAELIKPAGSGPNNKSLKELIENCNLCTNVFNKKTGIGTAKNGILIALNRPKISKSEMDKLKSESIAILKKMINAIGLTFEDCYITNLMKCESKDLLNRPSVMYKNCEYLFKKELEEKSPSIVIVMGNDIPVKKIKEVYKKIFWYNIEHPITLIKNPVLKRPAWETLKKIKSHIIDA